MKNTVQSSGAIVCANSDNFKASKLVQHHTLYICMYIYKYAVYFYISEGSAGYKIASLLDYYIQ